MTLTLNIQERRNIDIGEHLVAIGDAVGVEATRHRAYVRQEKVLSMQNVTLFTSDALSMNEWMFDASRGMKQRQR